MLLDFPGDVEQDLTISLNLSSYKIEMEEISTSLNLSLGLSQKSFYPHSTTLSSHSPLQTSPQNLEGSQFPRESMKKWEFAFLKTVSMERKAASEI